MSSQDILFILMLFIYFLFHSHFSNSVSPTETEINNILWLRILLDEIMEDSCNKFLQLKKYITASFWSFCGNDAWALIDRQWNMYCNLMVRIQTNFISAPLPGGPISQKMIVLQFGMVKWMGFKFIVKVSFPVKLVCLFYSGLHTACRL